MFILLELIAFLLPAILFSITKSEIVLYITLLTYFLAHQFGANRWYSVMKKQTNIA